MKLIKLARSAKDADRWYADLESGESLKIDTGAVAELSLFSGRELSEDELERLRALASRFCAKERSFRLLSARQMSRRELEKKLREKGVSETDIASAADLMERIGALNDGEYASAIVRHYAKKGYGKGRAVRELIRRGVPKELWEEALSELPEDTAAIDALVSRRLKGEIPEGGEKKKLCDMLLRRGYSWTEIKEALARYGANTEEIEDDE